MLHQKRMHSMNKTFLFWLIKPLNFLQSFFVFFNSNIPLQTERSLAMVTEVRNNWVFVNKSDIALRGSIIVYLRSDKKYITVTILKYRMDTSFLQ